MCCKKRKKETFENPAMKSSFYLCLLKLLKILLIDCDRLTLKDNPYDLKINAALKKEIL